MRREFKGDGFNGRPCVDHCHEADLVRGLLCHACNVSIGYMDNDPDRCRALAAYLERSAIQPKRGGLDRTPDHQVASAQAEELRSK